MDGQPSKALEGAALEALLNRDLAVVRDLTGKNQYEKFELSLPFAQTSIKAFCIKVRNCIQENEDPEAGYVEI